MAFRSVILGAPASGKGTISSRIVKAFGLEHIASGDRLRINIKENTGMKVYNDNSQQIHNQFN